MNFSDYQKEARSTAIYDTVNDRIIYPTLGLTSEAGEVSGKVSKWLRDQTDLPVDQIAAELGDTLWFIANLAEDLGLSLEEIAKANISKLKDRKERGVIIGSGDQR